jgi:hypothetical protein
MQVRNFVVDFLKGSTSIKEAKRIAKNTYRDEALKMRAIYKILNQIKTDNNTYNKRKFNSKKTLPHCRSHRRFCHRCGSRSPDLRKNPCLCLWHIC